MPEAAVETPVLEERRKVQPYRLLQKDFQETAFGRGHFTVTLPIGVEFEDALKQEFWVNVSHLLESKPNTNEPDLAGSIIIIDSADRGWVAELYVRAVVERGLIVGIKQKPVYQGPKTSGNKLFDTRWNPGKKGHEIIRMSDREIVGDASQFPIKEDALEWINNTITAMKV
jgi:hypothetical protein